MMALAVVVVVLPSVLNVVGQMPKQIDSTF
jgi:hypothetical protein